MMLHPAGPLCALFSRMWYGLPSLKMGNGFGLAYDERHSRLDTNARCFSGMQLGWPEVELSSAPVRLAYRVV